MKPTRLTTLGQVGGTLAPTPRGAASSREFNAMPTWTLGLAPARQVEGVAASRSPTYPLGGGSRVFLLDLLG